MKGLISSSAPCFLLVVFVLVNSSFSCCIYAYAYDFPSDQIVPFASSSGSASSGSGINGQQQHLDQQGINVSRNSPQIWEATQLQFPPLSSPPASQYMNPHTLELRRMERTLFGKRSSFLDNFPGLSTQTLKRQNLRYQQCYFNPISCF